MLCDDCKKAEATHHSIKKVNGVKTESHLCSDCFKARGGSYAPPFSGNSGIGDFLMTGFNGLFGEDYPSSEICSKCGTSADEFLQTSYVGCQNCYSEFAQLLLPRIQKMQHSLQHKGKRPPNAKISPDSEVDILKAELQDAIAREDFDKAQEISVRIKNLTGKV